MDHNTSTTGYRIWLLLSMPVPDPCLIFRVVPIYLGVHMIRPQQCLRHESAMVLLCGNLTFFSSAKSRRWNYCPTPLQHTSTHMHACPQIVQNKVAPVISLLRCSPVFPLDSWHTFPNQLDIRKKNIGIVKYIMFYIFRNIGTHHDQPTKQK